MSSTRHCGERSAEEPVRKTLYAVLFCTCLDLFFLPSELLKKVYIGHVFLSPPKREAHVLSIYSLNCGVSFTEFDMN